MKKIILLIIAVCSAIIMQAQQIELGAMAFPNWVYSSPLNDGATFKLSPNGSGLKIQYHLPLCKLPFKNNPFLQGVTGVLGLELSTVDWGNQAITRIGFTKILANERWAINVLILNGLALYVNKPTYVFGLESNVAYYIYIKKKARFKVAAGLRYTQNTSYKKVGLYRFVDTPISISWVIGSGK